MAKNNHQFEIEITSVGPGVGVFLKGDDKVGCKNVSSLKYCFFADKDERGDVVISDKERNCDK